MSVVGVDLGTTNTVVGCVRAGKVHVLADERGLRLLPSVVSFHPSGEVLVGGAAKARRVIDAPNTVYSHKRLIGRSWGSPEIAQARGRFAFELREGPGQGPLVHARGQDYTLPEISAFVLKRARQIAEQALGAPVERAVITVPAHFNELQRASTKVAGRVSGLEVLRILNEPTAAALAYGLGRTGNERVAVYDFGGGTFDCTLLDLNGNVFEVLATAGDSFLGGDDIDNLIADRMAEVFLRNYRQDARQDVQMYERLKASAEDVKIGLSTAEAHTIVLKDFGHGAGGAALDFPFTMTRNDLDALLTPLVDRSFKVTQDALALARLSPTSFDKVILVGGSTRIPLVRKRVESFFGGPPMDRVNPDEVVAIGAAIQAAALTEGIRRRSIPAPPTIPHRPSERDTLDNESELEAAAATIKPAVPSSPPRSFGAPPASAPAAPGGPFRPPADPIAFLDPPDALEPRTVVNRSAQPSRPSHEQPRAPMSAPASAPAASAPASKTAPQPMRARQPTIAGVAPPLAFGSVPDSSPELDEETQVKASPLGRESAPASHRHPEAGPDSAPGSLGRPQPPPSHPSRGDEAFYRTAPMIQRAAGRAAPVIAKKAGHVPSTTVPMPRVGPGGPGSLGSTAPLTDPAQAQDRRAPGPEAMRAFPTPAEMTPLARMPVPHDARPLTPTAPAPFPVTPPLAPPSDAPRTAPFTATMPLAPPSAAPRTAPFAATMPFASPSPQAPPPFAPASAPAPLPLESNAYAPPPAPAPFGPSATSSPPRAVGFGSLPPAAMPSMPPHGTFSMPSAPPPQAVAYQAPVLVDVTPRGLVVETAGGYTDTIIPRNSKIPCERTRRFATNRDGQTMVRVRVAQGENPAFSANTFLGEVELTGLRAGPRGTVTVSVTFEVDADGSLRVRAKDIQTGHEARATLQLVGIADESSVVMMISRIAGQPVGGSSS